jgi:hypothetical protein
MGYQHDTEFHDDDLPPVAPFVVSSTTGAHTAPRNPSNSQVPTPEQLAAEVTDKAQQLVALRERQAQIERAKTELEELRRKRAEFDQGRSEVRDRLTHAITLLEQSELTARREVNQLGKSLSGLREAANAVQGLSEKAWSGDNWNQDLSRDLAIIENARNELNAARLKWPVVDGADPRAESAKIVGGSIAWQDLPFLKLARIGIAMTWPIVTAIFALGIVWLALQPHR